MPNTSDSSSDKLRMLLAILCVFFILGFFLFLTYKDRGSGAANFKYCRDGLKYSCSDDYGCKFEHEGRVTAKPKGDIVMKKAVDCLYHCNRACCEEKGDPSCFGSCCNCLNGVFDELAPGV
ncbi:hypothetical protein RchiOBHm_Chr6g0312421 [Rosa chinensis]|uniref:Uncharacterized protein n=1 Tax=Rosa chinensis TaxID=74649 RepID=A0A2P6Q1Q1_ROSCH|nr:uncharacterized protein LOC112174771 [Rosa chinensis]PRQ28105.1 hypothetical protein RchiOBHm_Chr6g0312421 [Rosa chinensis]